VSHKASPSLPTELHSAALEAAPLEFARAANAVFDLLETVPLDDFSLLPPAEDVSAACSWLLGLVLLYNPSVSIPEAHILTWRRLQQLAPGADYRTALEELADLRRWAKELTAFAEGSVQSA